MVGSRLYVGGLPYGTKERDLERFFRGYGRMRDVLIKNGYGFVEFDDHRDADDAVYELNGKQLLGERVTVERARGTPKGRDQWTGTNRSNSHYGPRNRTNYRVVIENLSSSVSWQDLKDYMRQAGEVTYADAHKQYRNKGVVEFASHADMKNAIEKLDDTELNGRRIRVIADKYKYRKASASRSRSRSQSRSKSYHSHSRSRSRSKSRSASAAHDSKSRSRSKSRKKSIERSKSRSVSRSRSHSGSLNHDSKERSRSRSHDHDSKARSRSRSPSVNKDRSKSRSRSHSVDH